MQEQPSNDNHNNSSRKTHDQLQASEASNDPDLSIFPLGFQIDDSSDSNAIVYYSLPKFHGVRIDDQSSDSKITVSYSLPKSECFEQTVACHYLSSFPPGYDFNPSDSTLVFHYLLPMINGGTLQANMIRRVNIYKYNPIQLTERYPPQGVKHWYFFTSRDRKYRNGAWPNRKAGNGYWKATGADKPIMHDCKKIGFRMTLVFYQGKPPKGQKTSWIMHEFKAADPPQTNTKRGEHNDDEDTSMRLDDFVLCRIYKREEGSGGRSSKAQQDEEVEDDDQDDDLVPDVEEEKEALKYDLNEEPEPSKRETGSSSHGNIIPYNTTAPNFISSYRNNVDPQIHSAQINNIHNSIDPQMCSAQVIKSSHMASLNAHSSHVKHYLAGNSGSNHNMMYGSLGENSGIHYNYFDTFGVQQTALPDLPTFDTDPAPGFLYDSSQYGCIDGHYLSELPPSTKRQQIPSPEEISMPLPQTEEHQDDQNHLAAVDPVKDVSVYIGG